MEHRRHACPGREEGGACIARLRVTASGQWQQEWQWEAAVVPAAGGRRWHVSLGAAPPRCCSRRR